MEEALAQLSPINFEYCGVAESFVDRGGHDTGKPHHKMVCKGGWCATPALLPHRPPHPPSSTRPPACTRGARLQPTPPLAAATSSE